jgi:RecG-like helicase
VIDLLADEITPIGDVRWRDRVRVLGHVRSMRVQPWSGVGSLECTIVDQTGGLTLVFLGRSTIGGIRLGTRLIAEGMVSASRDRLVILNPVYELLPQDGQPG